MSGAGSGSVMRDLEELQRDIDELIKKLDRTYREFVEALAEVLGKTKLEGRGEE